MKVFHNFFLIMYHQYEKQGKLTFRQQNQLNRGLISLLFVMMMKNDIISLESTGIQKKCLGLTPIFFHEVYPKDHKIAHMEIFDVYLGEKFRFL